MTLRNLVILAAGCALAACATIVDGQDHPAAVAQSVADEEKPNILILFFDDLRFDSFSYRGGPVPTPNIDALAAESTRFDTAITTTGLCSPSRAALFTGQWGHRTGLDDNLGLWTSRLNDLNPQKSGIVREATDDGYFVGYVGKWHLGERGPQIRGAQFARLDDEVTALPRPYTPYAGLETIRRYNEGGRDANGEKFQYFQTQSGSYDDTPAAEKVRDGQEMIKLAAERDQPFLGVISFQQPHPPYRVPEPYASMFDPADIAMPSNYLAPREMKPLSQEYAYWPWHDVGHMTDTDWREARAKYYGAVAMIDRAVGEIIDTAKEEGIYDDLHIVFLGDQGSMIGEHGLYDKSAYAYDELMRIPLLMRDPGAEPRIVDRHVSLIDIPATLFEWMGITPRGPIDGRSLVRAIDGTGELGGPDDAIYAYEWYNGTWFGLRAIRTPSHKYVWNPGDSRDELYDLVADPGEVTNLINSNAHAGILRDLRSRLLDRLEAIEDPSASRLRSQIARAGQ